MSFALWFVVCPVLEITLSFAYLKTPFLWFKIEFKPFSSVISFFHGFSWQSLFIFCAFLYVYILLYFTSLTYLFLSRSVFSTRGQYALPREVHHNPRFGVWLCGRGSCVYRENRIYMKKLNLVIRVVTQLPSKGSLLDLQRSQYYDVSSWEKTGVYCEVDWQGDRRQGSNLFLIKGLGSRKNGLVACGSSGWQALAIDFPG